MGGYRNHRVTNYNGLEVNSTIAPESLQDIISTLREEKDTPMGALGPAC